MAPKVDRDRANKALKAMKDQLGFSRKQTTPVLKKLLKLFNDNWAPIEADGYRELVEAILDNQEETREIKGTEDAVSDDSSGPSLKKPKNKEDEASPMMRCSNIEGSSSLKVPNLETNVSIESEQQHGRIGLVSPQPDMKGKGIQCISPETQQRNRRLINDGTDNGDPFKQLLTGASTGIPPINGVLKNAVAECIPKGEIIDCNLPDFEVPLAMIAPPCPIAPAIRQNSSSQALGPAAKGPHHVHTAVAVEDRSNASCKKIPESQLASVEQNSSSKIEIASSAAHEVKVSLTISSDRPDFRLPSLESILKTVEDKCLREYKILNPSFSLLNVLKEVCQSASQLGSESSQKEQENSVNVVPLMESLQEPSLTGVLSGSCSRFTNNTPEMPLSKEGNGDCLTTGIHANTENGVSNQMKERIDWGSSFANSQNLNVVKQNQLALNSKPVHDISDLSRGKERLRIPLRNDVNKEMNPSSFYYISNSIIYQNAHVNFSLARIGDEDCCADCFDDCLAAPIPCACARQTGGEYAYTADGLLKMGFIDTCISQNLNPREDQFFYCTDCPLERSKNERSPDPCKGHLIRNFIKECWSKCGCSMHCGNRIVQRGITCSLQVFYTPEGKGWGLCTLEELPKGCFVCEYVGEVLTTRELHGRTVRTTGIAKSISPSFLDADWGSGVALKDEQLLCLDATFYGNVARFINHRCYDANLITIPVEIETPDHHYYHLAFFTTRKVEALEELTWDYGTDFNDDYQTIKAFRCQCQSKFCRDMKRTKRKSRAGRH